MFYKLFNRWLQIPGSRYIRLLSLSLSWFLRLVISSHDFSIASSLLISRKFLGRTIQNVIKKWLRNGLISLLTIDLNTRATIIYQTRYWECICSLIVFHRKRSCLQTSTAVRFSSQITCRNISNIDETEEWYFVFSSNNCTPNTSSLFRIKSSIFEIS